MSLLGHRFKGVEFRIFVIVFFRQAQLKNSKQIIGMSKSVFFYYLVVQFVQVLLVGKCQDIACLEIQSTQHPGWNQQERI